MSKLRQEIEEKLQTVAKNWLENDGRPKHLMLDLEEVVPELLQAFSKAVEEIIGMDEWDTEEYNDTPNGSEIPFMVRNQHRTEQRKRLADYSKNLGEAIDG